MQEEKQEVGLTSEQERQLRVIDERIAFVKRLQSYTQLNKDRRIARLEALRADALFGLLTKEYLEDCIKISKNPANEEGIRVNRNVHVGDYHTIQDYQAIGKILGLFQDEEKK